MNRRIAVAAGFAVAATLVAYFVSRSPAADSSEVATASAAPTSSPDAPLPSTPPASAAASGVQAAPAAAAASGVVYANRLNYNTESFKAAPLPERLSAMSLRRDGRAFDPQEVADALQSDVAWESDASLADKLSLSDKEKRDGREFIRTNPLRIEALMPGDELSLPVKQVKADGSLRMVVDRVQGEPGSLTFYGHLKDYPGENQVSLTRGNSLIVGGISVPDRNFVVQIKGDVGWVADGFTLFQGRHDAIDPNTNATQTHVHPPPKGK